MRIITLLLLMPGLIACLAQPEPNISVDKELFNSRHWNLAVLDLKYTALEQAGQTGTVIFQSAGADAGEVIASLLAGELANLSNINLVERGQIKNVLGEQKLQMTGVVDSSSAVEIGKILGADAVLIGNVFDYLSWSSLAIPGSTVSYSMRIIDVETGKVLTSGSTSKVENFTTAFQNAQNQTRTLVSKITPQ